MPSHRFTMLGISILFAFSGAPRLQSHWTPAPACDGAGFRQFDFFAGDWDTYDIGAPTVVVARNMVSIVLDRCVIREVYEQTDGLSGESFSIYDASTGRWHQTWVTNRGALLLLDGGMEGNRMVLSGRDNAADGSAAIIRGIWWVEGETVRETAERSTDDGKTWKPVFDIVFRHHR